MVWVYTFNPVFSLIQSKKLVTLTRTAGASPSQPPPETKEFIPICSYVSKVTKGPPESPLQIDFPPVATQMLSSSTVSSKYRF
uniref:Uncharacterized protein n=1 Tax=Megaselia scalaris TaxID=36166 RepID=T1GHG2_MEGSC